MRVTTGTVVNGRIEIPGEDFAEGTVVTILAPEDRESVTLGPEAEAELFKAVQEAEHQPPALKGTPGEELLNFFGTIDSDDCHRMKNAIDAGCRADS